MEKRALGNTDILVTKICLGTMTWGYQNTEADAHQQLDYAFSNGINFLDTAEIYAIPPTPETYTKTETYIGKWLGKRKDRDKIIVATKASGKGNHVRNGVGFNYKDIMQAATDSLKRLQTDYIDLYQFHWPQRDVQMWGRMNYHEKDFKGSQEAESGIEEVLKACNDLQKSGKVCHFGLSNETPWGVMKFLEIAEKKGYPRIVSIQNAYSLLRRDFEVGLAEVAMHEKVGLLAYSPLSGGLLSGKYQKGKQPAHARFSTWGKERMGYYLNPRTEKAIDDFIAIANDLRISAVQLALAFVNDRGFVTSNIIGATSMEQLKECISSADVTLTEEVREKIDTLFTTNPNPGVY